MTPFDFRPRTRVLFGAGDFSRLGEVARESGATKCLLVADRGMVERGYAQEATRTLKARRIEVFGFHDFDAGPTVPMIEAGSRLRRAAERESDRRSGRRQFHGLRQGDQFRDHQRRIDSRLLGLRKSVQADAAHDRGSDDGRDRQ